VQAILGICIMYLEQSIARRAVLRRRFQLTPCAIAFATAFGPMPVAFADHGSERNLGVVVVTGTNPSSMPTYIPTTMESITGREVEDRINATDSEDAIKYFPSLLVRKRYIGDYNHAILSSRASGTGNSARSAVYADGILLSNFLGNGIGGLSFVPRWGLVTPEEIERVDVMYGPFSAAYPGNSVGAVVDYVTRMPTQFEAHGKLSFSSQPFELYNTKETYQAWQTSASAGSRAGDWSWFFNFNHTDSHGQPLTFATRLVSAGTVGAAGTPVTGAVAGLNNSNAPWYIIGTGTEFRTQQDHAKLKLAYDLSPTLRASYTLGVWQNASEGRPRSYLQTASGSPVTSGVINIDGRSFSALTGGDFALTNESQTHAMHGLSVKSNTKGVLDWEMAASLYDYGTDIKRQNGSANTLPAAAQGGAGTIADGRGTGWQTLALKGIWRPDGIRGAHQVNFGVQQDHYELRYRTSSISGNWLSDPAGDLVSNVGGETRLRSFYVQDMWALAPLWKTVLGARYEHWSTSGGLTNFSATSSISHPNRQGSFVSPKAALSFAARDDLVLKASLGRAVRMPTVAELYGATSTTNSQYINDPNLRPERSLTGELSAEKDIPGGLLRATLFTEDTHDALYSQSIVDASAGNKTISRVQNVGHIVTQGAEISYVGSDVLAKGLDLVASLTYADSMIKENDGFVVTAGDTLDKRQPNIPRWRVSTLASYRWDPQWVTSIGARYSGPQFRTLNNSDVNGFAYQGVSKFFVVDVRARYQIDKHRSLALGVDNLNNDKYWNFHPYPQRTFVAELKINL
jgi:iron complex outermembrane receptor protein